MKSFYKNKESTRQLPKHISVLHFPKEEETIEKNRKIWKNYENIDTE